jgi:hypothetical protein
VNTCVTALQGVLPLPKNERPVFCIALSARARDPNP